MYWIIGCAKLLGFAFCLCSKKSTIDKYIAQKLLAWICDIRASEKAFYRQVFDIYATCIDCDRHADTSILLFQKVQNKMHFAVHGLTAAEVIYSRAEAEKDFMEQTTFSSDKLL